MLTGMKSDVIFVVFKGNSNPQFDACKCLQQMYPFVIMLTHPAESPIKTINNLEITDSKTSSVVIMNTQNKLHPLNLILHLYDKHQERNDALVNSSNRLYMLECI
ncbi:hypothetical protein AMECASPLE_014498 [Ameca splendens]|uniref:Uncharacterized protein n=1 Tax=Ameca splendens TaxID=208324 RepID=A0ABV0ZAH8_9TELE